MRGDDERRKEAGPDGQVPPSPIRWAHIRAVHKRKLAVIYVRQATPDHHTASVESQRALVERARTWGWPESLITIIEDLGFPGTSSAQRPGFGQLLELMQRGEVGIVLVRDLARLSRSRAGLAIFSMKALRGGVLVAVDGHVSPRAR